MEGLFLPEWDPEEGVQLERAFRALDWQDADKLAWVDDIPLSSHLGMLINEQLEVFNTASLDTVNGAWDRELALSKLMLIEDFQRGHTAYYSNRIGLLASIKYQQRDMELAIVCGEAAYEGLPYDEFCPFVVEIADAYREYYVFS